MIRRKIGLSIMMGALTFVPYGYAMDENKENNRNEAAAQESVFDVTIQNIVDINKKQREKLTPAEREQIDKELLEAVGKNDIIGAQKVLEGGADVNTYEKDFLKDNIPLNLACTNNNNAMVKMLLEAQADVNRVSGTGFWERTILIDICSFPNFRRLNKLLIMRNLIAAKADVNASSVMNNETALMVLASNSFRENDIKKLNIIEMVCLLVDAEADVNKVNRLGEAALFKALMHNDNHYSLIEALIYAGADLRAKNHSALKAADLVCVGLQERMIEAEKTRIQALLKDDIMGYISHYISVSPLEILVFDYMVPGDERSQRLFSAFIRAEHKKKNVKDDFEEVDVVVRAPEESGFEKLDNTRKNDARISKCVVS